MQRTNKNESHPRFCIFLQLPYFFSHSQCHVWFQNLSQSLSQLQLPFHQHSCFYLPSHYMSAMFHLQFFHQSYTRLHARLTGFSCEPSSILQENNCPQHVFTDKQVENMIHCEKQSETDGFSSVHSWADNRAVNIHRKQLGTREMQQVHWMIKRLKKHKQSTTYTVLPQQSLCSSYIPTYSVSHNMAATWALSASSHLFRIPLASVVSIDAKCVIIASWFPSTADNSLYEYSVNLMSLDIARSLRWCPQLLPF